MLFVSGLASFFPACTPAGVRDDLFLSNGCLGGRDAGIGPVPGKQGFGMGKAVFQFFYDPVFRFDLFLICIHQGSLLFVAFHVCIKTSLLQF